ncbi:hypothetical protein [Pseudoalteromonas phage KB12-38]|nr:hypothetical protein [Pseudoalteromonas phage KB12-38]
MSDSKKANIADKAALHYYFVTEVFKEAEASDIDLPELLGMGEDCVVSELYNFTMVIAKVESEFLDDGQELLLSDRFEYVPELANAWLTILGLDSDSDDQLPERDHFELDVRRIVKPTDDDRLPKQTEYIVMGRLCDEDDLVKKVYALSHRSATNKFKNWIKSSDQYKERVELSNGELDIYIEYCQPYSTMETSAIK